jgi:hypothetical protein
MVARVTIEMTVGLTPEIDEALKIATEFQGVKSSTFVRQAVLQRLVAEGFMPHPVHAKLAAAK